MSKPIDLGAITAYGIAKDHGFQGTEEEWLDSLKGEKGDPATDAQVTEAVNSYIEANPDTIVPDGSISEAKLGQDVKDKFSSLSEEIANIPGGAGGVGIQSVVQTTTSTEDGGTNVVTVTKTDGTTSTFEVRNGGKGTTPRKGTDYWTAEDQQSIVSDVLAALPTWEGGNY